MSRRVTQSGRRSSSGPLGPLVLGVVPSIVAAALGSSPTITITLSKGGSGATAATVDGIALTGVTAVSDTTVTGTLPLGTYTAGTGNVTVTSGANPSPLSGGFTFAAPPVISSISQNAGRAAGGTLVTIGGCWFFSPTTSTLGGSIVVVSSNQITLSTGAQAAGSFGYTVTSIGGTSSSAAYTYLAPPAAPTIAPTSGPDRAPQAATVTSSNLPAGFTGVPFSISVGNVVGTGVTAVSGSSATLTIPAGGSDGPANVVVSVDGVTATGSGVYTFNPAPTIQTFSQNAGRAGGGTAVNITGTGYTAGLTSTLGSVSSVTVPTAATLVTSGGSGATTYTVATTGGSSNSEPYTYLPLPGTITVSPNTTSSGSMQAVTLTTSNPGFPFGFTGVSWSAVIGNLTLAGGSLISSTQAFGTLSIGGSPGLVSASVIVDGGSSVTAGAFTFTSSAQPVLNALSGPLLFGELGGGPTVTLGGSNLGSASSVTISNAGGSAAVTPSASAGGTVSFTWPALPASSTPYNIFVTTPLGTTNTLSSASYAIPQCWGHLWYANQFVGGSTWTDVVGSSVIGAYGSLAFPSATSWLTTPTNQQALSFDGTTKGISASLGNVGQPGSMLFVGQFTSVTGNQFMTDGTDSTNRWAFYILSGNPNFFVNGANFDFSSYTMTTGVASYELDVASGGCTLYVRNTSTTFTQGGGVTTGGVDAIVIGSKYDQTSKFVGFLQMFGFSTTTPTSGQRTIMSSIISALIGTQ